MKLKNVVLFFGIMLIGFDAWTQNHGANLTSTAFKYDEAKGIGHEAGCTRRDPSDVIKVGDNYYLYYTKVYGRASGYWGTVWYATSKDQGFTWKEQGEILGTGNEGRFDSQATFTPNILYAEGKYWLYYKGRSRIHEKSGPAHTQMGVAFSRHPKGPFDKPGLKAVNRPNAPGAFRPDLTHPLLVGKELQWGISMIHFVHVCDLIYSSSLDSLGPI